MTFRHWPRLSLAAIILFVTVMGIGILALAEAPVALGAPLYQTEPTPDPCAPPTLRPGGSRINVREGPGGNYSIATVLAVDETVPIVGRAEYVEFWQVELPDGELGWVGDSVAVVSGYVDGVPIVDPPPLNGASATPGTTAWTPEQAEACPATPTPAGTAPLPDSTPAAEQTGADDVWSQPVNLSRSGTASNLQSVKDTAGVTHVVWQEEGVDSFFYARSEEEGWTTPVVVEVPFGTREFYTTLAPTDPTPLFAPTLVADTDGRIHAFWIDESGALRQSSVDAESFDNYEAWTSRQTLAQSALSVTAASDSAGGLHLAYVQLSATEESPTGVYYRQLSSEGEWTGPLLLYASSYFRSTPAGQAHLEMTTGNGGNNVYVVWDNVPLEKVFMARSADGGQSWEPALEVDGRRPDDGTNADGPRKIVVGAGGDDVVLLWQAGHDGNACAQYYQWSQNGGGTWSTPTALETSMFCSEENQLFSDGAAPIYLLTRAPNGTYLLAWDGAQWSEPQIQETLTDFVNADTFQTVTLGCHRPHLLAGDRLQVVGCGVDGIRDVWATERSLATIGEWLAQPKVWSAPAAISGDQSELQDLELVADSEGRFHAFWSDEDAETIYYARWNGSWTQPFAVLASPEGRVRDLSVAVSPEGRLLAAWSDPETGRIYFSEASTQEATSAADWSTPRALVTPQSIATSPAIALGTDDTLYLTYAIPFNEERGIYLLKSDDQGETWTAPSLVLSGDTLTRSAVSSPHLAVAGRGRLHLLWQLQPLSSDTTALGIYYSRSSDDGQTWTTPEAVTEAPVTWSRIVSSSGGAIFGIWQEIDAEQTTLRYQASLDGGITWTFPAILSWQAARAAPAAVTVDAIGRIHLLQLGVRALEHWIAESDRWVSADALPLQRGVLPDKGRMAAAFSESSGLFAVYTDFRTDSASASSTPVNGLFFTNRSLELPASTPTPAPTPTPTASPPATETAMPTPSPTPTRVFPTVFPQSGDSLIPFSGSGNSLLRLAGAVLPAMLIVVIGAVLIVRFIRPTRR